MASLTYQHENILDIKSKQMMAQNQERIRPAVN